MEQAQRALKELNPEHPPSARGERLAGRSGALQCGSKSSGASGEPFSTETAESGNATNLPVDSTWSADWNHSNDGPPRGYTFAAIELPRKRFLLTYSLHLKSNVGAPVPNVFKRQESAKQLLRHTDEMLELYSPRGACFFVVAGDMNTSLNESRWENENTLPAFISSGFR